MLAGQAGLNAAPEATAFLAFTGDERAVADAAAEQLQALLPIARLHGASARDISDSSLAELGRMGWFGLALPEAAGGSGLSAVELGLFFREVGRRCGPVDLLAQVLGVLASEGDLRDRLMAGETGVALAVRDGEALRLLGRPDRARAVQVEPDGARLLDGLGGEARPALDTGTSMRVAAWEEAACEGGAGLWQAGQVAVAAMLVGVAEAALDLIVEYAGMREAFGRKIGAFQAVRHGCADMAVRAEAARSQLWYACAALKRGREDAGAHLDAAKYLANVAAVENADACIQLHGGIGITEEHDAHLLLERALLLRRVCGTSGALLDGLLRARVG